jgi:hypothetical protein
MDQAVVAPGPATREEQNREAADAALKAFVTARALGRTSVDCYRAGVAAWRKVHPEQSAEYAAKRAVAVILSAHISLRVDA